ncbi:LysR family transcriptional regulator [Pectobacterium aroidearum]|uniref:LysR family transcriptional regulator n=1 Tax=Pectobacterium aroidearum TaxID=1201031 RepID=UPI0032EF0FED
MSLIRLRTFVEVYRQRSISGASRALNLTQPAVSQHIAGLEVAVGRRLFERQANGVTPTSAADDLAADLGDKLDEAEAALASARARSMDVAGTLHIIGHADFMAEVVSEQLLPLLEAGVRVHMHTGDGDLIKQMLLEGHCDLGITAHPVTDKRLKSDLLKSATLQAVAAPAIVERLLKAGDLPQALAQEPMLAYDLELPLIDHWLKKNRMEDKGLVPAVVSQDLRALRRVLTSGFGWTVMPVYLCQDLLDAGELVIIPPPVGTTQLDYYLAWVPGALRQPRLAHARQTFLWRLQHAE